MKGVRAFGPRRSFPILFTMFALLSSPSASQTIRGRLLDAQNGQPTDLGILTLFTTDGDTVGLTATTPDGRFSLTAPESGSFLLRASAFGYAEKEEGVFELGEGGRVDIEFRIASRPMELDEILVSTDRPTPNHPLIRNGFVERYQRGLGHFIGPRDIEESLARTTEQLLSRVPGLTVRPSAGYTTVDQVLMMGRGAWCTPAVYVDGLRVRYDQASGLTLSLIAPVDAVQAIEVYRRPAEIPLQYGGTRVGGCGVLVIWTK